jgi:hypothetical protein
MKKFHYNFNFMLFMVQEKNDDIAAFYEFINCNSWCIECTLPVWLLAAECRTASPPVGLHLAWQLDSGFGLI